MTCIIGIECVDGAIIAGDYLGSNGFTKDHVTQSKISSHSGMLFGYTSTFRFGQIIECCMDDNTLYPPTDSGQTYSWLIRNFVPKVQKSLKDAEYVVKSGANAIIVVNKQVWELQDDLSVIRSESGITSVGSGVYHALASVGTQIKLLDKKPTVKECEPILKLAYEVISEHVTSVSTKFNFLTQT